jgi:thioester reductase-like protein
MATPSARIPEAPIQDLSHASPNGYARSKLIAESMIENAVSSAGANATILRIGQIVPSKSSGSRLWNPNEMIPLLVRSALTTGALPDTPGGSDRCSWIDVDTLSKSIVEIEAVGNLEEKEKEKNQQLVYNLVHPRPFSWKNDLLPDLKNLGLEFEVRSWGEWVERLKASEADVERNPSRKLLGFWVEGSKGERREVVFETSVAEEKSVELRKAESILSGDYIPQLLAEWKAVW